MLKNLDVFILVDIIPWFFVGVKNTAGKETGFLSGVAKLRCGYVVVPGSILGPLPWLSSSLGYSDEDNRKIVRMKANKT
jgi:hypothetical protein